MKNIEITIIKDDKEITKYISDILPNVGDSVDLGNGEIYCINGRIFVTNNNRVRLYVESIMI